MANSKHYRKLGARFTNLRRQFLPTSFSATGVYSKAELDNARAFRLLIHAEIEQYFEDRALEILERAYSVWQQSKKATRTLVSLMTNIKGEYGGLSRELGAKKNTDFIIGECCSQFRQAIRKNNGVKKVNVLGLYLPLGLAEDKLDAVWLAALDSFGSSRGDAAHASWITYNIDPKTEFDLLEQIFAGLSKFDVEVSTLYKSAR